MCYLDKDIRRDQEQLWQEKGSDTMALVSSDLRLTGCFCWDKCDQDHMMRFKVQLNLGSSNHFVAGAGDKVTQQLHVYTAGQ